MKTIEGRLVELRAAGVDPPPGGRLWARRLAARAAHPPVDAVVAAYNEERTVAAVVRALLGSGVLRRVIVVDDGSRDATAARATDTGAEVITWADNRGKAEAMLAGASASDAPAIAFFDADLLGLSPEHVRALVRLSRDSGADQVCGLQDYGVWNAIQGLGPLITGQRVVRRWVLDSLPLSCWRGYAIEVAINTIVTRHGGITRRVVLPGLRARHKAEKVGWWHGWRQHLAMYRQLRAANDSLAASSGTSCEGRRR